ncbi:MAG: hypothetical protein A3J28_18655 [Acidobacteria bacterium RIFCSPLOWO2_12_FULL_60_22]|nr:MAG: hypothetical protein A3J28_18655 [Acidobacteria bacterium RIFCSPLOWO2_12_FULL_60_22]
MSSELMIRNSAAQFQKLKELAENALAQVPDTALFEVLDEESNSIAIILKHLSGNLISRWTDFLTSDGEKPNRNRDSEFRIEPSDTRERLMERWEAGWRALSAAFESLRPEDLEKTVWISGEPYSVLGAIHRHLIHCAYHVGQLVLLAKHHAGSHWQTLSVPRGKSEEYTAARRQRSGSVSP